MRVSASCSSAVSTVAACSAISSPPSRLSKRESKRSGQSWRWRSASHSQPTSLGDHTRGRAEASQPSRGRVRVSPSPTVDRALPARSWPWRARRFSMRACRRQHLEDLSRLCLRLTKPLTSRVTRTRPQHRCPTRSLLTASALPPMPTLRPPPKTMTLSTPSPRALQRAPLSPALVPSPGALAMSDEPGRRGLLRRDGCRRFAAAALQSLALWPPHPRWSPHRTPPPLPHRSPLPRPSPLAGLPERCQRLDSALLHHLHL